jgi:hypothetical protein
VPVVHTISQAEQLSTIRNVVGIPEPQTILDDLPIECKHNLDLRATGQRNEGRHYKPP